MPITIVGVDYVGTPVALRERLAIPAAEQPGALARLRELVGEGLILSTCNRTEVIAVSAAADAGVAALTELLVAGRGLCADEVAPHLWSRTGDDAARHLCAVAAGLDSLVLGEDQIQAQLRAALDAASAAGALGPVLHRLGHAALATGKRVRAETAIGRGSASVVSAALRAATAQLGTLAGRVVLIVGAGETAELVLKHLTKDRRNRPAGIVVTNRTHAGALALASRYNVDALPWDEREPALADADLVVTCTAAPGAIIAAEAVQRAMATRPERPLFCFDLAVPRDIDPAAATIPGVELRDVDALAPACAASRRVSRAAVAAAEAIVAEEAARFFAWWRSRDVAPAIVALRDHAEALRDVELARALARLPELGPREEAIVRALAAGIVNKLLHRPVTTLKSSPDGPGLARAAGELFGLEVPAGR
jgi:glutamyl-tRNA reductase